LPQVPLRTLMIVVAGLVACGTGELPYDSDASGGRTSSTRARGGSSSVATDPEATPIGSIDECSVVPVNPNATQQARNLLCYLYSIYGTHVLSGQQETSWDNSPSDDVSWIRAQTGKYPAILGGDYLYPNGTTTRAAAWWDAGGIPMIRYHAGAPPLADSYDNSQKTSNIDAVLTEGTAENDSFNAKLDYVAEELRRLQDANVAILWAPLHEAQPGGWFWWSKGTGEQYVELWIYMYNYLTNVKGVNNLVWLLPFSGSVNASFYPGKDYVDLAGPDTYATDPPFAAMFGTARDILGTTIPIPLHETGVIPNPDTMFPGVAPWVLFNVWAGFEKKTELNTPDSIKAAYASPYTVTRDEIPSLK
jgi:hypothetical protein